MEKVKLSKTQEDLLKELRKHKTFLHFMPYMGRFGDAYYFVSETMTHVRCSTVDKLIKLGLLKSVTKGWNDTKVYLKDIKEENCDI